MGNHKRHIATKLIRIKAASSEAAASFLADAKPFSFTAVLEQNPLRCVDIKAIAASCCQNSELLIVDNIVSAAACNAIRLGADAELLASEDDNFIVRIKRDYLQSVQFQYELVDDDVLPANIESWSRSSDCALAFASYLSCHPKIECCAYPGLKSDPSFIVAAQTLERGFGPLVSYKYCGNTDWHTLDVGEKQLEELIASFES